MNTSIKRWLGWLVLVVIFSISCFWLSQWQFNRRAEALARNSLIAQNYDQPAVGIDELISSDYLDPDLEWRTVSITGHFLIQEAVLVRNRPYNGAPGFLQLVPFERDSGKIIAIETGWLPTGDKQDSPDSIPLPSATDTTITARLRFSEPTVRQAPANQISAINIEELVAKKHIDGEIYKSFYARLTSNYSSSKLPQILPKPELTEGNHLSYAMQWILFALMSVFAFGWAIRQEKIRRKILTDPTFKPTKRRQVGDRDKDVEDAILDSTTSLP